MNRIQRQTSKLSEVEVEVSPTIAATHRGLGQVLAFPDRNVYLALASQPGTGPFELLVSQDALDLLGWQVGGQTCLPEPKGAGFSLCQAEGMDVLMFAVGSAMGPMRSVVNAIRNRRADFGWVRLYAGARGPEEMPYRAEFEAWARDRIDVIPSYSRPWVQERFAEDPPVLDDAVAFVCGMESMMQDVQAVLERAGLSRDRILRNW
ncbi:MAG: hypothetical protein ACFB9M_10605 [Myxococcota bacterium]